MEAMFFMDCFENRISLYQEVLEHAIAKHPEASSFVDRIGDILGDPDETRVSNSDPRVVLYYQHRQEIYGGKWLVVVVKRLEQHFVSTFYMTSRPKAGDVLWKK